MGLFTKKPKPVHTAYITNFQKSIEVKQKQTLLEAALDAGLDFPYSCGAGSCTTCKCKLLQGEYKDLANMGLVLNESDKKKGYILACQAVPVTDLVVTIEGDDSQDIDAEIIECKKLTHDILRVKMLLANPIPFKAGQYADIFIPGIKSSRSYSFASAPLTTTVSHVEFHIRLVPGGEMSTWFHSADRTGQKIKIQAPRGSFGLNDARKNLFCIAGGSGMAPIKAILESALALKHEGDVVYLFGARTENDLYCIQEIESIASKWKGNFTFVPILSHEPADSSFTGKRGFVTEFITSFPIDFSNTAAYLCGPPPMIDSAMPILIENGIALKDIHFDKFSDRSHLVKSKN